MTHPTQAAGAATLTDAAADLLYEVEDHLRSFETYEGNPVPFNKHGAGIRVMRKAAEACRFALASTATAPSAPTDAKSAAPAAVVVEIDRLEELFDSCVLGMVSADYAKGYREALGHARRAFAPPCKWCNGTGVDGDVDDRGATIDVPCACVAPTPAAPSAPASAAPSSREPWFESELIHASNAGYAQGLIDGKALGALTPPAPAAAPQAGEPVAWMNSSSLSIFATDRERYPLGGGGDMATARYMRSDHHDTPLYLATPSPALAQPQPGTGSGKS